MVRVLEMRESLKIVRQAMAKITHEWSDPDGSAGNRAAGTRKNEDGDGSAHLSLQDFHGRIFTGAGRGVCDGGIATRRIGLFYRQRRIAETAARAFSFAVVHQFAGLAEAGDGAVDFRRGRVHRDD